MIHTKEETLLQVNGVNKSYDGKVILRDINFEIKNIVRPGLSQGQVVSLVGRSGSGKSTLAYILANLIKPDSGTVLIDGGRPVNTGEVGVVFQNYYVYGWRKVRDILKMAFAKNKEYTKSADHKVIIDHIAGEFSLWEHLEKYPSQLSGGQKQRVAIAEQILNGGNFIFLDEPFSGLDTLTIDKVTQMLVHVSLSDELKTLIIVSHDLSNSIAISDTVYILAKEEGKEGATITTEIDLIERGLAWQSDIKENHLFRETLKEIKSLL